MMIDYNKPVETREGSPARIYSTDTGGNGGTFPIHGAIQDCSGEWVITSWTESGRHTSAITIDSPRDLLNSLEYRWLNIYHGADRLDPAGKVYKSRAAADEAAGVLNGSIGTRAACVKFYIGQNDR